MGYGVAQASYEVGIGAINPQQSVEVFCPEGSKGLGGGGICPASPDSDTSWVLQRSQPIISDDIVVGWLVQVQRVGPTLPTALGSVTAYVIYNDNEVQ